MKNKINRIIIILTLALVLSLILIFFLMTNGKYSIIKDNTIYAEEKNRMSLELYNCHESSDQRFITPFMFPGDEVSKEYDIKAYYRGDVKIYFRIHNYDDLNELMDIRYDESGKVINEYGPRVKVIIDGKQYYNGFFRDLPKEFVISRSCGRWITEKVNYKIVLSLDKGVTSDFTLDNQKYQGKNEYFDMEWWIEGGVPYTPPVTGIYDLVTSPNTYVFIIAGLSIGLIVFFARRKKDYE